MLYMDVPEGPSMTRKCHKKKAGIRWKLEIQRDT